MRKFWHFHKCLYLISHANNLCLDLLSLVQLIAHQWRIRNQKLLVFQNNEDFLHATFPSWLYSPLHPWPYTFCLHSKAANRGTGSNQSTPIRISQQLQDPPSCKSHQISKRIDYNTRQVKLWPRASIKPYSTIAACKYVQQRCIAEIFFLCSSCPHTFCQSSHESRLLPQRYEQSIEWATDRGRQEESRQSPVKGCLIS